MDTVAPDTCDIDAVIQTAAQHGIEDAHSHQEFLSGHGESAGLYKHDGIPLTVGSFEARLRQARTTMIERTLFKNKAQYRRYKSPLQSF